MNLQKMGELCRNGLALELSSLCVVQTEANCPPAVKT